MEIEVIVDVDGSVIIRYNGFLGRACYNEAMRLYNILSSMGLQVKIERVEETTYVKEKEQVKC
ncbi:MAG: hypothetical protein QXT67_04880 [Candidatus Bathyarchaeia archaeon]